MKHLKRFNEGFVKNIYNFYKLVKILRGWKEKYKPEDYDSVIKKAFDLIDSYDMEPDKLSPPFTLPNDQLDEEFIEKFFAEARKRGYSIKQSIPGETTTKFNLYLNSPWQN